MPYKNARTNKRADKPHAEAIASLHKMNRTHYDTPGSIRHCACVSCNEARRSYGERERTWQGLARTKP